MVFVDHCNCYHGPVNLPPQADNVDAVVIRKRCLNDRQNTGISNAMTVIPP
ncbi:MAG: hypothetical protein GY878_18645 [Fuerstiella sp.]|nr:hypothetical protein [Fuerstiella sp.]